MKQLNGIDEKCEWRKERKGKNEIEVLKCNEGTLKKISEKERKRKDI